MPIKYITLFRRFISGSRSRAARDQGTNDSVSGPGEINRKCWPPVRTKGAIAVYMKHLVIIQDERKGKAIDERRRILALNAIEQEECLLSSQTEWRTNWPRWLPVRNVLQFCCIVEWSSLRPGIHNKSGRVAFPQTEIASQRKWIELNGTNCINIGITRLGNCLGCYLALSSTKSGVEFGNSSWLIRRNNQVPIYTLPIVIYSNPI